MIMIRAYAARQKFHAMKRREGVQHGADDEAEPPKKIIGRERRGVPSEGLAVTSHHRLEFFGQEFVHKRQRLNQAAANQPCRMPAPVLWVGKQPEKRFCHETEDHGKRDRLIPGFGLCFCQPGQTGLINGLDTPPKYLQVKALFVPVMVVDGGQVDFGNPGNLAQSCAIVTILCKELFRSYYYPFKGFCRKFGTHVIRRYETFVLICSQAIVAFRTST